MSYYGGAMGLITGGAFKLNAAPPPSVPPTTTGGPGVMPPDLVQAISNALNVNSFAASDARGQKIRQTGLLLGAMVNAAKGAPVSAQAVLSLLIGILNSTPGGNAWINGAFASSDYGPLQSMTLESIVSDIGAGKYRGAVAPQKLLLSPQQLLVTANKLVLPMQQTTPKVDDVPNPAKDQQCADGYFRDATGMCAPQTAVQPDPNAAALQQQAQQQAAAAAAAQQAGAQTVDATVDPSAMMVGPADLAPPATVATTQTTTPTSSFPWLYVGIGAAGLAVVGWMWMGRSPTPNRGSKKSKKSRTRRARRARKA